MWSIRAINGRAHSDEVMGRNGREPVDLLCAYVEFMEIKRVNEAVFELVVASAWKDCRGANAAQSAFHRLKSANVEARRMVNHLVISDIGDCYPIFLGDR